MIYLDYNATTPVDNEVQIAMQPYWDEHFGNAASRTHLAGWDASEAVKQSRHTIAKALLADPKEIVFTSGATESLNLAIKGIFDKESKTNKKHILTVRTEHKAVLDTISYLENYRGASVTFLDVDPYGNIDLQNFEKQIREDTLLAAIMFANNETGIIHPVEEIGQICRKKNVRFVCDATQAVGKIEVIPQNAHIDLMAFSSHKIYGPKGVGGLYVREGIKLQEQMNGGGHERGYRSGTLNVPGIVGFAKAMEIAESKRTEDHKLMEWLRDNLEKSISDEIPDIDIHGRASKRLPNVSNILFRGVEAEALLLALSTHVAVSSGSACNSASILPSHVLLAMGASEDDALSSIRFSLGRPTTKEEIDQAITKIKQAVQRIRG